MAPALPPVAGPPDSCKRLAYELEFSIISDALAQCLACYSEPRDRNSIVLADDTDLLFFNSNLSPCANRHKITTLHPACLIDFQLAQCARCCLVVCFDLH